MYQKHFSSAQLVYLIKKHVTNKSIFACFHSSMSLREFCWAVSTRTKVIPVGSHASWWFCFPFPWSRPVSVRQSGLAHGGFTMWNPVPRCFLNPICSLCAWEPHHGVTHCCFAACAGMGSMGETVQIWTISFQNETWLLLFWHLYEHKKILLIIFHWLRI